MRERDSAGCHSDESIDPFGEIVGLFRHAIDVLGSTLRVSYNGQFLATCDAEHFLDLGWHVVDAHVGPIKVPAILERPLTIPVVLITVQDSPIIAQPDVVALVDKPERHRWAEETRTCRACGTATKAMLKQDG